MAESLRALFETTCRRHGLNRQRLELSTAHFRRHFEQLALFGEPRGEPAAARAGNAIDSERG
jgi:hypothetical protein